MIFCSIDETIVFFFKLFTPIFLYRWFAGKQIRNVGSIGGNIINGSPISDLNPIFMASSCTLTLASKNKTRSVKFDQNFYTGYRKTILEPNEILVNITIPFTKKNEHFVAFKQVRLFQIYINSSTFMSVRYSMAQHISLLSLRFSFRVLSH